MTSHPISDIVKCSQPQDLSQVVPDDMIQEYLAKGAIILDVRSLQEFKKEAFPMSLNIPFEILENFNNLEELSLQQLVDNSLQNMDLNVYKNKLCQQSKETPLIVISGKFQEEEQAYEFTTEITQEINVDNSRDKNTNLRDLLEKQQLQENEESNLNVGKSLQNLSQTLSQQHTSDNTLQKKSHPPQHHLNEPDTRCIKAIHFLKQDLNFTNVINGGSLQNLQRAADYWLQQHSITKDEFLIKEILHNHRKHCHIIDVRTNSDYLKFHPKKAINFPLDNLLELQNKKMLDAELSSEIIGIEHQPYLLVFDFLGIRAARAVRKLKEGLGYKFVFNVGSVDNMLRYEDV
ncbi:hypothetical protein ABK040_010757 [Willaertia magna]